MVVKSRNRTSHGLTRRRFVSLAAAGAAASGVAGGIGLRSSASGATALQEGKTGGSLRVVYAEEPVNLHPQITSGTEGWYVQKQIYDGMVNIDSDGTIIPGLATGLPEQTDDLTFVFQLREGVTFHNGKPFTADDVLWTFDRLLGKFPELVSSQGARFAGQIERVEKIDDYTVQIMLKQPWPDFLPIMASDKYMSIMQKDAELENPVEYGETVVVGTGPFKFKEWVRGDHLTLVRNEEYWGDPAYVDEVVYKAIPEESTRMNALKAGEIDILLDPSLKDVEDYERDDQFKVLSTDGGNMKIFVFNTSIPPFNEKKVRQAVAYAIDRQEIVDAIYYGYASVGEDLLPPWNPAHDAGRTYYPYDPEKARQLLAEAGYGDGTTLEFELLTTDATEFMDLGTLIQAQLEQVGVKASITPLDKSAFLERTLPQQGQANPNFQADVYRLIYGYATSDYTYRTYHPQSSLNLTGYNQPGGAQNPEVPPLLEDAAEATDLEQQKALYGRLSDLINDDMPLLRLAFQKNVIISRSTVQDLGITVLSVMPLRGVWLEG